LLQEAIDDYVVADNPVRFIDAFVDGLDLAAAGFKRGSAAKSDDGYGAARCRASVDVSFQRIMPVAATARFDGFCSISTPGHSISSLIRLPAARLYRDREGQADE